MEVWLDLQGLPRKVNYAFDYNPPDGAPAGTPDGRMTVSSELYDYGADVDVNLPPANKVSDFFDLMPEGT
jgi:hypothetical protein